MIMGIKFYEAIQEGKRFRIEGTYPIGAYLYVFDLNSNHEYCDYDYLQDDIDMCKKCANDIFHVPYELWRELPEETLPYSDPEVEMSWCTALVQPISLASKPKVSDAISGENSEVEQTDTKQSIDAPIEK